MITIREWMNNKTILITGGAGFMGKVLIEKLLRSCPGVKRIYLIIRAKRNQTPQERWNEIIKDELFKKLLTNAPDIMDQKVTVLDGDMSLIDLGLSRATIEELKHSVNIIFHSAATVRFNDPLSKALLTNTRGTLEMCKLASEMDNLEVFIYVSTAFCNQNLKKSCYTEDLYEPCQDWRTVLKLLEEENPAVLNTISYKVIQDHPNTYTFTKSLNEKIVKEYSGKFPTVIARPPVVLGVLVDPVPGWTDNVNGLMGLTTAVCKGVMRVGQVDKNFALDCVPADIAINALIICGWEKATSKNKELSVYNCTDATMPASFKDLFTDGPELNEKHCPLDNDIWYPFCLTTTSDFYFCILFYFLNVIPALLIDTILVLMKKKRRLMKVTIKIYLALRAVVPFAEKQITFDCKKYKALWSKVTEDEAEIFYVRAPSYVKDSRDLFLILHKGIKKYFLKENLEEAEYCSTKLRRFYYLHQLMKGILISTLFVTVFKWANIAVNRFVL